MAKHKAAAKAGPDPEGEAWMAEARSRWEAAVAEAERVEREFPADVAGSSAGDRKKAARARKTALEIYAGGPPLPDFRKMAAKDLELGDPETDPILGRFLFQPGRNLVHDVTNAGPGCEIRETPRVFVHFASELEANVPADAEPHSCMTAG